MMTSGGWRWLGPRELISIARGTKTVGLATGVEHEKLGWKVGRVLSYDLEVHSSVRLLITPFESFFYGKCPPPPIFP